MAPGAGSMMGLTDRLTEMDRRVAELRGFL
jgi:hypothetical protein